MPLFLFWYILRDLLKILVVTTAVLVVMISFGAAIQPLSEGLIGPVRVVIFILLAMPPMLQFALPFSAGFSATLVYHRMTQDNEMAACAAAGVPYTHLLMPAATLGVILTISLSFLSNYACPHFWEAMHVTAHLDAPEYIVRSIERDEPIEAGDLLIYARAVESLDLPPESEAYAALRIYGLVVASREKGRIRAVGSAPQGVFTLQRVGDSTVVTSKFDELTIFNEENNDLLRTVGSQFPPRVIPDTFRDKPKFMNLAELQQIVASPEEYWRVRDRIEEFRSWLIKRQMYIEIDEQLKSTGRAVLVGRQSPLDASIGVRLEVHASGLGGHHSDAWNVRPDPHSGTIRIMRYQDGAANREYIAHALTLIPSLDSLVAEPAVACELEDFTVRALDSGAQTRRSSQTLRGYHIDVPISGEIRQLSIDQLADLAREFGDDEAGTRLRTRIDNAIKSVHREILARIHERTALSVSCLAMMLLGATLAIRLRGSLPLTVYFWSFVPAILGLLLISGGADVVKSVDASAQTGLVMTWSGNLIMLVTAFIVLRRVARN